MGKRADSKILHRLNATHVSIFKAHAGMGAVILEGHEIDAVVRYIEALELDAARRTTPDREAWISVDERLPEEGEAIAFVVHCPGDEFLHGRVLGGTFHSYGGKMPTFSVPGIGFKATYWMPLPTAPAHAARARGGES